MREFREVVLMQPQFLTFRSSDGASQSEWLTTGYALLRSLAEALEDRGFTIDLEAGAQDPDWYFLARRGSDVFAVVLVLNCYQPCCWSIGLEDGDYHNLASDALRAEISPILESVVKAWPSISKVRWHADATTLKEA
jgi:hypothetical protein